MAITMKATRAAIKTARNLEEVAAQVAAMQEQLNRIEDMLLAKVEAAEEELPAETKPAAKTPAKTSKKGG